jgi:hypothetical protein
MLPGGSDHSLDRPVAASVLEVPLANRAVGITLDVTIHNTTDEVFVRKRGSWMFGYAPFVHIRHAGYARHRG